MTTCLLSMLKQVQMYKREKTTLMPMYIEERLEKSFNQYDKQLQQSIQFLTRKHEKSLLKRIKKIDDKSNK